MYLAQNTPNKIPVNVIGTRKCYRRENRGMPLWISICIEFYNQSITERLCTLNTATLSTRTHLAPKPA